MTIKPMTLSEIRASLCRHDKRNPLFSDARHGPDDGTQQAPRNGCVCDNCFHGRDRLAVEILRLKEELDYEQSRACLRDDGVCLGGFHGD